MCCRDTPPSASADPAVTDALDYLVEMYGSAHTPDRINTTTGHWINEAFVIRLWAVLEAHHISYSAKPINKSLRGAKEADICRRLRHKFAHATGLIRDKDARKLDREIRQAFSLGAQPSIFDGRFILSKDAVLLPLYWGCREYALAVLEAEAGFPRGEG